MITSDVASGVAHEIPSDLKQALISTPASLAIWQDIITPLGRNEWICWVEDAKKPETRAHRIERVRNELTEGKRRPCCWAGCRHRTDR